MQCKATAPSTGATSAPALVPIASGALKLTPMAAPPPRMRKLSKLKHCGDELPGLAHLLEHASLEGLRPKTPPSRVSLENVRPASQLLDVDNEGPVRRNEAVRSAQAQQNYVETRLYRRTAAPAGSLAALQKKLADLQQERCGREKTALVTVSLKEGDGSGTNHSPHTP